MAASDDVALQLDPVNLRDGMAYSVFAIGSAATKPLGGNAFTVLVAERRDGFAGHVDCRQDVRVPFPLSQSLIVAGRPAAVAGLFLHSPQACPRARLVLCRLAGAEHRGPLSVALVHVGG